MSLSQTRKTLTRYFLRTSLEAPTYSVPEDVYAASQPVPAPTGWTRPFGHRLTVAHGYTRSTDTPDSLQALAEAVREHYTLHPTHEAGCGCLDPLISGAVLHLMVPGMPRDRAHWGASDLENKQRRAVVHLVFEIARRM